MKKIIFLSINIITFQLGAQNITNYTISDGLLDNFIECINVDVDNNIWFGTSVGVQMYDPLIPEWTNFNMTTYPDLVSNNIKVINSTISEIWIGSDFGINVWNEPIFTTYNSSNGLNNNQIKSIDVDWSSSTDIWIGNSQGVSHFNGSLWVSYSAPDLHWSGVNATAFDSNGDKWFASPLGGVTHFDGINFTVYDTANGLLSQNVRDIIIDNHNNKWIGTGNGITVLDSSNSFFTNHTKMYLLSPPDTLNPVVDIEMDSQGRIWVAIYVGYLAQGGIAMWDGSHWIDFDESDGIIGPNIRGLSIDSEDNVWIATSSGVSKISSISSSLNFNESSYFTVFPNPTNGFLKVKFDKMIENLEVYNLLGSLMYSKKINTLNEIDLNLSHLTSGIYNLVLTSKSQLLNQKIIVK